MSCFGSASWEFSTGSAYSLNCETRRTTFRTGRLLAALGVRSPLVLVARIPAVAPGCPGHETSAGRIPDRGSRTAVGEPRRRFSIMAGRSEAVAPRTAYPHGL